VIKLKIFKKSILLKILLPPSSGEQGATGSILANGRGTFSEKGHLKICGKTIKQFSENGKINFGKGLSICGKGMYRYHYRLCYC
jgi:hypothetical protein